MFSRNLLGIKLPLSRITPKFKSTSIIQTSNYHTLFNKKSSSTIISNLQFKSNSSIFKRFNSNKLSPHDSKASGYSDIKRLFQLAKPETKPMIGALCLLMISSAISMTVPLIIGKFLDSGHESMEDIKIYGLTINQFFAAIGGVFLIGAIANTGRVIILRTIGEKLVARLRTRTLKASLEQDASFLDNNRVGDLISRLSSDASIVSRSVTQNISDGIRAILSGGVGLTMMSLVSWKLTSIMALLGPPLGIMAFFYGRKIRNISRDLQKSIGDLTKIAEEQLNATRTIQAYGNERLEVSKYAKNVRQVFQIGYKEAKTSGVFFGTTGLIANIGLITLLGIGSNMIRNGSMTVGELSSFMMYAVYTGSSMFGLSNFYSELMKGAGAAARIFELNDRTPEIPLTKGLKPTNEDLKSKIKFENVSFYYPTRPNIQIFKKLSFEICPGEHICIVGPSGSGKSTITSLLLRFYDLQSGEIKINDENIKNFNLRQFRKKIGVVQQEPALFSGTILDNITYGITNYTKENLQIALEKANVLNFINEFPDKLDTIVGPRGTQLSGGQRQRIALARALLLDPSLLILDESTSALDTKSEKIISETLYERSQRGLTTISIAHRVSTIKHSSRILVLGKEGNVVETGSFNDLIKVKNSFLNQLLSKNENEQIDDDINQDDVSKDAEILKEIEQDCENQTEKDLSLNK